jgi:signal transduction histidine kinase
VSSQPSSGSPRERLAGFFALDDDWARQGGLERRDLVLGAVTVLVSSVLLELMRSVGAMTSVHEPLWLQYLAVVTGGVLVALRRRWPLAVAGLAAAHMFVVGVTMPAVMGQLSMQVIYFVAIFSGVAWAASRRDMAVVVGGVVVFMFVWLAWQFAIGSGVDSIREDLGDKAAQHSGLIGPVAASVIATAVVNILYFGGAIVGGQVAWRSARQRARLAEQAATIERQGADLQRRAVTHERLRIARELHDVVAHHVSVIGIQAAASRRVMDRDPQAAALALGSVEESSREAVAQMRSLVGALRDPADGGQDTPESRAPDPGWRDLPQLVEESRAPGLDVSYHLVESEPGAVGRLPAAVGLSVFRIVQESLTNVRRHSTATAVTVVLRVEGGGPRRYVEVEVTDNGRPRPGTSGSGLGLLGVRERAASGRGEVEIGPRVGGGYRVRVRFPLELSRPQPRGDRVPDPVARPR